MSEKYIETLFADSKFLHSTGEVVDIPPEIMWQPGEPMCSVIIPCYNYGHFLREAIQSALDQTLKGVEILVVDDGSTDAETREVLRSLVGDSRIKLLLKGNEGLSESRNMGIRAATGKYICCLDADDILHPSYLEHCVYELESDGYLGMVYSWVRLFGDENYIWQTREFNLNEAMVDNHTSVSAVFRRSDWLLAGKYDRRMEGGYEDWEFWLRIAQLGRKGHAIKAPLFFHRRHGRTMTHDAHDKRQQLIARKKALNFKLFNDDAWRQKIADVIQGSDAKSPAMLQNLQASDSKLTLLCVLPWLKAGGAEILMLDVLHSLSADYHICVLTTLDDDHSLLPKFRKITSDIFHFPANAASDQFVRFIQYLARTRNAWTILTSGSLRMYEVLPLLDNIAPERFRVVDILHNDSELGHFGNCIKYNQHLIATIGVSTRIVTSLANAGIEQSKLKCILNGVDGVYTFTPRVLDFPLVTSIIAPQTKVIGFVGRAAAEKRPLLFVELFRQLSKKANVRGLMVCSGYLLEELNAKIEEYGLDNLIVLPEVDRAALVDVYRQMDILVNVSSVEGMPLTVLEALACGCPVAAMEVGNLSEVITHGENGILVGQDQFDELMQELMRYICMPEQIDAFKARARDSFERMGLHSGEMLQVYRNFLERCFAVEIAK